MALATDDAIRGYIIDGMAQAQQVGDHDAYADWIGAYRDQVYVGCITCSKRAHPANMCNVYDGEYQCQECRWGL